MTGFSNATKRLVFLRADGRCERCGWIEEATHHHHRRPRGMGGSSAADTNGAANCLLLCHYCHAKVESERDTSLGLGLLVHQLKSPSETPVWRFQQWVLLDDYGYVTPVKEEPA
jgi:5-methylcytosine-specific restriction enzyme A